MTGTVAHAPALALTLPGEWHALTLGDDAAITGDVAQFVRERFGRRDDHATVRADQRARLAASARRARDAGATQFHLSLTAPGGIALASSVAEYHPRLPLGAVTEPAAVADGLVRVLVRERLGSDGDHWAAFAAAGGAVFDRGDGLVVRLAERHEAGEGPEALPATRVDYWLTRPGRAAVVLLSFSTALAELEPLLTELFDAVVAAAGWIDEAPTGAPSLRAELGTPRSE